MKCKIMNKKFKRALTAEKKRELREATANYFFWKNGSAPLASRVKEKVEKDNVE